MAPGESTTPDRRDLPTTLRLGDAAVTFRSAVQADRAGLLALGARQSGTDLLYMERDLTSPADVGDWLDEVRAGRATTVLACDADGDVLGYASLTRGAQRWTRHVGDLRMLVDRAARRRGIGRALLAIVFDIAHAEGTSKLIAQVPPTQAEARALFVRLGFQEEAVLRHHVQDVRGQRHDVLQLSLDVEAEPMTRCEECGRPAPSRLALAGQQLCWRCYELRAREIGGQGGG